MNISTGNKTQKTTPMTEHDLRQFTGTEHLYKHWCSRMVYTDGVEYFAEHAGGGAYWFVDIVGTEILPLQAKEEFISITLKVTEDAAVIVADDGNENELFTRVIDFTDCEPGAWKFYLIDSTLILPSEY